MDLQREWTPTSARTIIFDNFRSEKRFDRFPEAEAGFYNSVKIAIALFSTIVGSYPYSHIQNWLSTNSTMNGTGQGLRNRFSGRQAWKPEQHNNVGSVSL